MMQWAHHHMPAGRTIMNFKCKTFLLSDGKGENNSCIEGEEAVGGVVSRRELQLPALWRQLRLCTTMGKSCTYGTKEIAWYYLCQHRNKKDSLCAWEAACSFVLWECCDPLWFLLQLGEKSGISLGPAHQAAHAQGMSAQGGVCWLLLWFFWTSWWGVFFLLLPNCPALFSLFGWFSSSSLLLCSLFILFL